jgi:hypothetical protein
MKGRILLVGAVAVAAITLVPAPATATHVQCGALLTTSTTLDSDVVCPDGTQYGLLIGADNVLLKMNGFALRTDSGAGFAGIFNGSSDEDGLQGVRIKRGSIEGFLEGISLNPAHDTTIFKVEVTTADPFPFAGDAGISLIGNGNWVEQSTVTLTGDGGSAGIGFTGDDAYAWGNVVNGGTLGSKSGVWANGDRARLVYNRVTNCGAPGSGGSGVQASGYSTSAIVNRNIVSGCATGVTAQALDTTVGGAKVALNQTTGGIVGVRVTDAFANVNRNTAREASDTGILLDTAGTFVRNNGAFDNGNVGIFGPEGTVDGGGNVASGNGDGTGPQCVNVECSAPPPPT